MKANKKIAHNLKDVVMRELGIELEKKHQAADWGGDLTHEMLSYAVRDSEVLFPLVEVFDPRLQDDDLKIIMELEHRALPALAWISNAGVPFDTKNWRRHLEQVEEEKVRLELVLKELAPNHPENGEWNWNSWQQVLKAFSLLGLNLPDTKEETLSRCDHTLASTLLEYRRASKLLGTYGPSLLLDKVEDDGRIYPSWWQIGAGTGRMACSSPNLQNLPPRGPQARQGT